MWYLVGFLIGLLVLGSLLVIRIQIRLLESGNFSTIPMLIMSLPEQDGHMRRFCFKLVFQLQHRRLSRVSSCITMFINGEDLASMAERIRLRPYIVLTSLITCLHSITAHWVWSHQGFLYKLGTIDAAGCSVVIIPFGYLELSFYRFILLVASLV